MSSSTETGSVLPKTIEEMCLLDDTLMSEFVKRDRESGYQALRVILKAFIGLDMKVRTAQAQSLPAGPDESISWVDVEAEEENGRISYIGIMRCPQEEYTGYYGILLGGTEVRKIPEDDSLEPEPDAWAVIVTPTDTVGDGAAVHRYRWADEEGVELGIPPQILVVNGAYEETDTLVGQAIHDLMTNDPQDVLIPEIREPFACLKATGRENV